MAALHATTTGTGLTLGAGADRLGSPRRLAERWLARLSGTTLLDAPETEAFAGGPEGERELRDATLWATRSSRLV